MEMILIVMGMSMEVNEMEDPRTRREQLQNQRTVKVELERESGFNINPFKQLLLPEK